MTGAETVVLREMRWWDIEPVLELERELFPEDAWSRGMFWSELAHARGPGATRRYVVAQEGDRIVGYAGLAASGAAQDGEPDGAAAGERAGDSPGGGLAGGDSPAGGSPGGGADVQTIAVTRDHWGTGLGSRLLTDLLRAATAFECSEVLLECRVDNVRAQKLYERFGFETIGVRRGYYQPGNVDALVMRLTDPSTPPTAPDRSANGVQGTENHG
ncbi:GNAT family N-acetyltransferase [Streptomyces sp. enrichment culture]|uniref:GNAT family N-acetyltransferase n=1 Tax=Streptomyces sp. enrichment culture TaxID=1795815 RepID=UPI003F56F0D5